jgi:energy-coupling factor transport system permease protein
MARLDPRVLVIWYAVFALLPWLFFNRTILIGICLLIASAAVLSKVSGFVLFMLAFGVLGELLGWGLATLLLGGNITVFSALSTLILKFLAVSLASIAIFSSMDPDRFSDALLAMGVPEQFAFAMSYGYRMVPVLLEEYQRIIHAYRLRGKEPEKPGFLHLRQGAYFLRLIVRAFYPMILNTALRTRTTVESLEVRGFTYALENPEAKELRLRDLAIGQNDIAFLGTTTVLLLTVIALGSQYPL